METWFASVLAWLALPQAGLSTLFVVALVSATLLPLGSEPALLGLVALNRELLVPAVLVATLGNTLGGMISWATGHYAARGWRRLRGRSPSAEQVAGAQVGAPSGAFSTRALAWLQRWGPRACLLSWLPLVGDPLCAVAGWLGLPLAPCAVYMGIGKFLLYAVMTALAFWIWPAGFGPH